MPDIASIGHGQVGPVDRTPATGSRRDSLDLRSDPVRATAPERPGDRVELSDHARYLDHLRRLPEVRHERIDELRASIARGEYETDDKYEVAVNRLLEDLGDDSSADLAD